MRGKNAPSKNTKNNPWGCLKCWIMQIPSRHYDHELQNVQIVSTPVVMVIHDDWMMTGIPMAPMAQPP